MGFARKMKRQGINNDPERKKAQRHVDKMTAAAQGSRRSVRASSNKPYDCKRRRDIRVSVSSMYGCGEEESAKETLQRYGVSVADKS